VPGCAAPCPAAGARTSAHAGLLMLGAQDGGQGTAGPTLGPWTQLRTAPACAPTPGGARCGERVPTLGQQRKRAHPGAADSASYSACMCSGARWCTLSGRLHGACSGHCRPAPPPAPGLTGSVTVTTGAKKGAQTLEACLFEILVRAGLRACGFYITCFQSDGQYCHDTVGKGCQAAGTLTWSA
jgi:hypothetical protein